MIRALLPGSAGMMFRGDWGDGRCLKNSPSCTIGCCYRCRRLSLLLKFFLISPVKILRKYSPISPSPRCDELKEVVKGGSLFQLPGTPQQ
jgi:hypothetical protein